MILLAVALAGCGGRRDENPRLRTAGTLTGQLGTVPDPPRVGLDTGFVLTLTQKGAPISGAVVNLATFYKSMNQTGPTAVLSPVSPGRYEAQGITTGMNGKWEAQVTVSRPNQPDARFTFPFRVAK